MIEHDELCPESEPVPGDTVRQGGCLCYLIGKVRADERERIAQAIAYRERLHDPGSVEQLLYAHAEQIARGEQ